MQRNNSKKSVVANEAFQVLYISKNVDDIASHLTRN